MDTFDYTLTADDALNANTGKGSSIVFEEGETFPALVVRENEDGSVNAQVFVDGAFTLYVQNVTRDGEPVADETETDDAFADGDADVTDAELDAAQARIDSLRAERGQTIPNEADSRHAAPDAPFYPGQQQTPTS